MSAATEKIPNHPSSLREARRRRRLSQVKLAEELGVRQNWISDLERGERAPGPMARKFLALFFGLPVEVVAGWFIQSERKAA